MMREYKKVLGATGHDVPELRQDVVSGEWILVAPARRKRPQQTGKIKEISTPRSLCPFEDPLITNSNGDPLAWYSSRGKENGSIKKNWILQVIKNKYPALAEYSREACPSHESAGPYKKIAGVGSHEVVIPRSHTKFLWDMTPKEAETIIAAYQDRFQYHAEGACLEYIFIFHNHGRAAGASVWHPHSQLIALPIIPPDVRRSIRGSELYFHENNKCAHCEIITWERTQKERIIYQNKAFIVIAPFASRIAFEVRIFPLAHAPRFERMTPEERAYCADALVTTLKKIKKALRKPAFNFFIHTAPIKGNNFEFYHWHLEILPKTSIFAGVELGTGIEVLGVPPEEAATLLRRV